MDVFEKNEKTGYTPYKHRGWAAAGRADNALLNHFFVGYTSMKCLTLCGKWLRKDRINYWGLNGEKCPECETLRQSLLVAEKMAK